MCYVRHRGFPARRRNSGFGIDLYSRSRTPARKRAWVPSSWSGNFRLPIRIADRLKADTGHLRNRDAVFTLIVYLARHHAGPKTIARGTKTGFWIVREALAQSEKVNLTEDQIRGAIKAAITAGIIEPLLSREEMRQPGRRANLPQLYRFTGDYAEMFTGCRPTSPSAAECFIQLVSFSKSPIFNIANEVSVDSGGTYPFPCDNTPRLARAPHLLVSLPLMSASTLWFP
jgi:hypothetical protein